MFVAAFAFAHRISTHPALFVPRWRAVQEEDPLVVQASSATTEDWRPTSLDLHIGWVHGLAAASSLPHTDETPRQALEAVLLPALQRSPCVVSFSGGRDSSAVLAVATALARREGLPEPIPVIETYPGIAESDETTWQELVLDHLGVRAERLVFGAEQDLLGEEALASLLRLGVLFPPSVHLKNPMYRRASGGYLLTGEGGDEVFGARRVTPLVHAVRGRHPRAFVKSLRSLAPAPARASLIYRQTVRRLPLPWVRPEVYRKCIRQTSSDMASEPLSWAKSGWWLTRRRIAQCVLGALSAIAEANGARALHPLLEPRYLAAVANYGGRWGFVDRTELMLRLFNDVLPERLLRRTSKAYFNNAYAGRLTREFAQRWDGSGVDDTLVDPERLREAWLAPMVPAPSTALLHVAWLATEGADLAKKIA